MNNAMASPRRPGASSSVSLVTYSCCRRGASGSTKNGGSQSASLVMGESGGRSSQGENRARGVAKYGGRSAGGGDYGAHVLDLSLDRVRQGVAALAAAAAVVVEYGEVGGEELCQ